jgi:HSP20 family molecular chaperone IbpA
MRPAATIIEKPEGFFVEADMPGVARDAISITVEDDTLTIAGKRNSLPEGKRALHRETGSLDYRRAFELGREIDRSKVAARFNEGVLQVFLPKAEELKARRIEIAG